MIRKSRRRTTTAYEKWYAFDNRTDVVLNVSKKVMTKEEKVLSVSLEAKGPHGSIGQFVTNEFFDKIKTRNPWSEYREPNSYKRTWGLEDCYIDPKDIFSGKVKVTEKNLVYLYHAGHVLFDHKGDPLPTVFHLNWIGTPFSNEYLDVEKAVAHLKKHPWIVNGEELIVDRVPYYNNEEGWKKEIKGEETEVITILPTRRALKEMYEKSLTIDKEYWSVKIKELLYSGPVWSWNPDYDPKKSAYGECKDYLKIKKFYKPHEATHNAY